MAVVVYKCDTCKRSIEIPRNIRGIETVQRCTITLGCRGKLYQSGFHQDYVRGSIPDDVEGLDNWQQRKVIYNHRQQIASTTWTINHNLGVFPSVSVFIDQPTAEDPDNQTEIIPTDIVMVTPDTIIVTLEHAQSGIAQLVARSSDPHLLTPVAASSTSTVDDIQISNNGKITIASRIDKFGELPAMAMRVEFVSKTGVKTEIIYTADSHATGAAWSDVTRVIIRGKVYAVRHFLGYATEMTTGEIVTGATFRFKSFDINTDGVIDYYVDALDNEIYSIDAAANAITVNGDVTSTFVNGFTFIVTDSAGANGSYTVDSSSYAAGRTVILVSQDVPPAAEATPYGVVTPAPQILAKNDIILLLGNSPFGNVDKITNRYIDVTEVTTLKNTTSLYYDDGEFFGEQGITESAFPTIRTV